MKNYFLIEGDTARVFANGKHKDVSFLVDAEKVGLLSNYSWRINQANKRYQNVGTTINIGGKSTHLSLSRLLMNAPPDRYVDHKNCNPLDNRMANLRFATTFENSQNAPKTIKKTSSKYKGVGWHRGKNKWIALIQCNNAKYYLGYFTCEIEAAKAYDQKAKELFGDYAFLNFPI